MGRAANPGLIPGIPHMQDRKQNKGRINNLRKQNLRNEWTELSFLSREINEGEGREGVSEGDPQTVGEEINTLEEKLCVHETLQQTVLWISSNWEQTKEITFKGKTIDI